MTGRGISAVLEVLVALRLAEAVAGDDLARPEEDVARVVHTFTPPSVAEHRLGGEPLHTDKVRRSPSVV